MRKLIIALLAAGTAAAATPALADGRDYDRYDWQAERQARAAEHTRRVQERNTQRIYRETARAQARSEERLYREGRARDRAQQAYDRRYDDRDDRYYDRDDRYYAANDERAFRRFADRNRDGRISRAEYEWAQRNW